jgi:Tfp pilus assembly protein PilX
MLLSIKRKLLLWHSQTQGQILLIVVLTMIVSLTVGLAVVSRSIVQVKTAKDEADSQKAFSAAEAGVEQALQTNNQISNQSLGNNAAISSVSVTNSQPAKFILNNGTQVLQDDGMDIWLSTYPTYQNPWTGRMRVYWGTASGCSEAALEIIVISQKVPGPGNTINHYAYDPCASRINGQGGNSLTLVNSGTGGTINGQNFNYSVPIDITSGLVARVIPLYTNTTVAIAGFTDASESTTETLPSQGKTFTSVGTAGSTQREVVYFQGYNSVPSELFYSLFSP